MEKTKCAIEFGDGVLVVSLCGEIDHHCAAPLREEIDRALYLRRARTVVLDLAGVTFMDSYGLALILGRYTRISDLGGQLIVANPSAGVEKILDLAGAQSLITIRKNTNGGKS